jgi:hypothetical protein
MEQNISTRFTVAKPESVTTLLFLTGAIANEKYSGLVDKPALEKYIAEQFNEKTLKAELNSLSNQWLIVYAGNEPVGYARITSKGLRPAIPGRQRLIRIADFGILAKYDQTETRQSLLEKSLHVGRSYEAIWINAYLQSSYLDLFQQTGFVKQETTTEMEELSLPAIYLIKDQG